MNGTVVFRALLLTSAIAVAFAEPASWNRFRGPNATGVADGSRLPKALDPESNALWRTPLPPGASSPALTAERVFVTAYEGDSLRTFALDRETGRILWRRALARPRAEETHQLNNPASASPVTDGSNVFAFFGDFGVISYGPDGEERWRRPLGPFKNLHGMASSPILADGKLIVLCDQDVGSFLLALNAVSGEQVWRTERPEVVHGFATPTIFEPEDGPAQLVVPGSYQLASYDVASGEKLWWVGGVTWQVKTAAVVDSETVYMTGWAPGADAGARRYFPPFDEVIAVADADGDGKLAPEEIPEEMRHTGSWKAIDLDGDGFMDRRDWTFYRARWASVNRTLAVKPAGARGDLTETHVVWDYERGVPVVSSPLLYRGALHTIKDGGILTSFDPESGKVLQQARLRDAIDKYYASPVAGDGKIYLISETCQTTVMAASAPFETLSTSKIGEACYATPALADGVAYVRTESELMALR